MALYKNNSGQNQLLAQLSYPPGLFVHWSAQQAWWIISLHYVPQLFVYTEKEGIHKKLI